MSICHVLVRVLGEFWHGDPWYNMSYFLIFLCLIRCADGAHVQSLSLVCRKKAEEISAISSHRLCSRLLRTQRGYWNGCVLWESGEMTRYPYLWGSTTWDRGSTQVTWPSGHLQRCLVLWSGVSNRGTHQETRIHTLNGAPVARSAQRTVTFDQWWGPFLIWGVTFVLSPDVMGWLPVMPQG